MSRLDNLMQQAIDAKLAKLEEDKLQPSGEVKNEYGHTLTPHEFSCFILDLLNKRTQPSNLEIRTLCLMVQNQAVCLHKIRELTHASGSTTVHLERR